MTEHPLVIDCFFNTAHAGTLPAGEKVVCVEQPNMRLYASFNDSKQLVAMRFQAQGHPYIIAGLEYLCRELSGSSISAIESYDESFLMRQLGMSHTDRAMAVQLAGMLKRLQQTLT